MWKDVYEDFSKLSKSEQLALFEAMKQDLFPDEPDKITKLLKSIRESRFASGLDCLHCGSTSVKRNGKYRSRQRYLCKDEKRGISNLKIAVVVAQDRNGNVIVRKAGAGRVKAEEIDNVIGDYIHPPALLCTDTATNYKKFARIKGLQHETVNERQKQRVKKGIYHIQHVNNFHNRLKGWMERFQGVATKYLDNYLYWFRWLELGKNLAFDERVKQMLISACQKSNNNTVETLRSA